MFTDSGGVYSWLCSFVNMERGLGGRPPFAVDGKPPAAAPSTAPPPAAEEHFRLDRMRLLSEMAGNPERSAPVIHIAGSKGKGSVCAMTSAVLEAAGKRPGRYMSPHVVDWRERICLGGAYFPEKAYADAGNELFNLYQNYRSLSSGFCGEPTFFELITLLFFICSRNARCLCMVVETGLGGRLDATNIVEPRVTVISAIEKEHTEYLGSNIEKIAEEKAGIIKRRKPLVLAGQNEPVLEVFLKKASEQEAPLTYLPRAAAVERIRLTKSGTAFSLTFTDPEFAGLSADYSLAVPGTVYPKNAALALLAAKKAFPDLGADEARSGLAAFRLPARFEALGTDPPFIVDGAHTPQSTALCAETFSELYGAGGILLFGCAKEKNPDGMAEALLPYFSTVIITSPGTFRESDPENVYGAFYRKVSAAPAGSRPALSLVADTKNAFKKAARTAKEKKLPVLVCGSFYLAGEVIRYSAGG
ncbi:MAG: bifunctional folylpolyglutamate synthase/dihydrofolate synthase [Treponema sp.]|nr:bifunctional folylpolyglutamate synthase/dihydrofolate synthase [Treponema sp.]